MSDSWRFSPSSEEALKELRDKSAVDPFEKCNKWLEKFKDHKDDPFRTNVVSCPVPVVRHQVAMMAVKAPQSRFPMRPMDAFYRTIEAEPIAHFEYMLEEGSKNHILLKVLALRLSGQAAEKVCKLLFDAKDLKPLYVEKFFHHFFPDFLKRGYSWFSLDILVKANKLYPQEFRTLLRVLLQDRKVSNTMINDFVLTLDWEGKYEFLTIIIELELSTELFVHNLISITSAYKGAEKTEFIQNYVLNCLLQYSSHCSSDLNYGRFLLAYLYSLSTGEVNFDIRLIERLIEVHRSPFKRPCLSVLGTAIRALSDAAIPPEPS